MINMDADAFFHGNLWLGGKKELCYFVKLLLAYWTLEQPRFLLLSIPILLILFFIFPFFWNLCLNFTEMASIAFSLCCYLKHWLQEEVCVLLWRLHTLAPIEEEKSYERMPLSIWNLLCVFLFALGVTQQRMSIKSLKLQKRSSGN